MFETALWFVLGGVLLIGGAELLVRGASRLALTAGISPLVIGLTVVAFGTGSPELAVAIGSAYTGQADVAMGNVIGSNIFNILFILGIASLVAPLVVAHRLVQLDVPIIIGASVLTMLMAIDGRVGQLDGLVLFVGLVFYTVFLIRQSRRETAEAQATIVGPASGIPVTRVPWPVDVAMILVGLGLLVVGSQWLVAAAVASAAALGVSELVIGLTIVAVGTSLPEVATSVLATLRGERDIAVGNVVGSSIFNLLGVLGLGSIVAPEGIAVAPGALTFDLPIMIAVAIAALPIFFTGHVIARWEGAVFLGYYVAYATYLVLDATNHAVTDAFGVAMLWFVLPLTALTLVVVTFREVRDNRPQR